ncbi:MAG: acyl-CoA dehydrogenase family protein [Chloroflexi bacterium]|nr:acyl-CoA dehydrogenase family protein [Chloroflexota bacterium]
MDFVITEEQQSIKRLGREFAEREVAPFVRDWDRDEYYPMEVINKMGKLGLMGGVVSPKYGGAGMDFTTVALLAEEVARVDSRSAIWVTAMSASMGQGILTYGTEEQKLKYVAPACRGEVIGSQAVTEPHSGTDVVRKMETTATKDGDDYIINGAKIWISNLRNASWFVTFATLDKSLGHKGVCAFVIEKALPGVSYSVFRNKVGHRSGDQGELIFDSVRVPKENRVGPEYQGYKVLMCGTEMGRLACSSRALGAIWRCLEESVKYAQERIVFGQPIGRYQLVQSKITDMVVGLETARLLVYKLAWLKDQGVERVQQMASMAKMYATDVLMHSAVEACQIHGAYSCSDEYEVGRIFRDAKFNQILDGNNDMHRQMIAEWSLGYRGGQRGGESG